LIPVRLVLRARHPEASRIVKLGPVALERMHQSLSVVPRHVSPAPDDLEGGVEGEEGLETVLLIPKVMQVQEKVTWVFLWKEDVMHVNKQTGMQAWKNLEL